ncbi:MAG: MopE-related protein [Kofleriaceae bacterium]
MKYLWLVLALVGCGEPRRDGNFVDGGIMGECSPGDHMFCYDGPAATQGVGACRPGNFICDPYGHWGTTCEDQVLPEPLEVCGDTVDKNCDGVLPGPGNFEVLNNGIDDDCDGNIDNAESCDTGIQSDTADPMNLAKAIDLCKTTTMADTSHWGLITAALSYANGSGTPSPLSHAVRPHYGTNVLPKAGSALLELSTGPGAAVGDVFPDYVALQTAPGNGGSSPFPSDFLAANAGHLPNSPGCPEPNGNTANDPVMLALLVRVPVNAKSFTLQANFFSAEFPEWVCSPYDDYFVVLLDSTYMGATPNPADKNIAFYQAMNSQTKYPVGVNLAYGNTGLFQQCVSGATGCSSSGGQQGTITCPSMLDLVGTGLDTPDPGRCDASSVQGGGTGWLTTTGNVVGGEIMLLRVAIWNTSDESFQSLVVLDNFQWSAVETTPGTVISKTR